MFVFQLFCFVSWKAICFTYCSLAKPLQFTNLLLHKFNRILWVKPYSTLEVFNSCPQWQLWSIWTLKRLMISQLNTKKRDGLRARVLFVPDFSRFRPGGTALKLLWPVTSKIQQTKISVTCQRFGDLFLFGLVWQYSSQNQYDKGRFKVMATYLQQ